MSAAGISFDAFVQTGDLLFLAKRTKNLDRLLPGRLDRLAHDEHPFRRSGTWQNIHQTLNESTVLNRSERMIFYKKKKGPQ